MRPSWTSDRFIPNRSAFHLDIARSSIENAERNLSHTFETLSKRRLDQNGENSPQRSPGAEPAESVTPLQEEFRRRMRGALLNIPLEDVNTSRVTSPVRNNTLNAQPSASSSWTENRENIASIVYASLPDHDEGSTSNRPGSRLLSFQGMKREASFRSSGSSLTRDDSASDVLSSCTPSTPQRRLGPITSSSSPRRAPPPPSNVPDPFSHDQLHVLHRLASGDSLSMAETRLRSVSKSIGRRIPKTPSRILDAPELVDDYYLNLVSWGNNNVLAVALGQCVYLWEAETGNIRHLLTLRNEDDFVTSVAWATMRGNSNYIAVGTNHNAVQL